MTEPASQPQATAKRGAWLLAVIALPLCALGAVLAMQAAGVCVGQQRYWTDDELIEVAVRAHASGSVRDLEGRTWHHMAIQPTTESVQAFLKENPRCCSVDRSPDYRGIVDVLFGWNAPEVQLNYERSRDDPKWPLEHYYQHFIAVSTCGEVLKNTKGIGSQTLEHSK